MSISQKFIIAQTALNTDVEQVIPTMLTVDGRQGWSIKRVTGWFLSAQAVLSTVDITIGLQLNTETGNQTYTDSDSVASLSMLFNGTAASTSGFQIDPKVEWVSLDGRLTVQPNLYLRITSANAGAVCSFAVEIEYDLVKLSDIEVMRLLQGGA